MEFNIGAALRLPKLRDTLAECILPEEAIQRILAVASNARNRVLVRLLYSSDGRISEVVSLRWHDCQPRDAAGQVTFFGKGGKTRAVLLSPMTWHILQALRQGAGEDDPVFVSQIRKTTLSSPSPTDHP